MKQGLIHWDGPPLEAWKPWTPWACAQVLEDYPFPWCIVGGWALDLSLGRVTREHEDLEIAVTRDRFESVRSYLEARGLHGHSAGDGQIRRLEPGAALPPEKHQCWMCEPAQEVWRVDVMLEPGDDRTWIFRRDERIRAPRAAMIGMRDGVPHLSAAGALLYKAKAARPKDEADFAEAGPLLAREERAWLDRGAQPNSSRARLDRCIENGAAQGVVFTPRERGKYRRV